MERAARGAARRAARGGARAAARRRARHLLAQGLHPADDALPRRLRLLHVRAAAAARRARVHDRGRGARDRAGRRGRRLPRGALHARRQAGAALPRRARRARGARLRDDARVPRPRGAARARRDRAAAAPEPGRDEPRTTCAALRPVSASMGIMLETTAERLSARGGPHWASPDKLPARAARDDRARRRAADPVHERDPDRDRRDARGAARRARGAATRCTSATATCRR